ncbi:MAG TPA: hypothetical protein VGM80_05950 [Gaiellaceae bacterium]|jgi:hypothetical protein
MTGQRTAGIERLDARGRDGSTFARRGAFASALPIGGLWLGLSLILAAVTTRVQDWFAMTNELLYERRAISVAESLSPLPDVHGVTIHSYDQLYSLLVAPAFAVGGIPADLRAAHALNALIMASACIPTYLIARRVTRTQWASLLAGALAVCMPWILFASFLMTEVAAYPAFLWAVFALHRAVASPSRRNDALVLLGILLAFTARTQLGALLAVPPVAVLALELGRGRAGLGLWAWIAGACRRAVADHRLLAGLYAFFIVLFVLLRVLGDLGVLVGVYGEALGGSLLPHGLAGSFVSHLAALALGLGVLPPVVGLAWLSANVVRPPEQREAHAFACVGLVVFLSQLLEVTIFDIGFGGGGAGGFVHDRYLLYLAPIVLIAFFCALADARRPRWSLFVPCAAVALGFVFGAPPTFVWKSFDQINSDAPILFLWRPLVQLSHTMAETQATLVFATIVLSCLFALGAQALSHRRFTVLLSAFALIVIPGATIYMFDRLLTTPSWSSRPITQNESANAWLDAELGTGASVAIAPYATTSNFYVNQQAWRDLEFWNKSVTRDVQFRSVSTFRFTDPTFPKLRPIFNTQTGVSDISPASYVVEASQESRFRVSGPAETAPDGYLLIHAEEPWRTDWMTFGLYDDGWTKPGVTARVRVFPALHQAGARIRTIQFALRTADEAPSQPVRVVGDPGRWRGAVGPRTVRATISVCVPAQGFSEVRLSTPVASTIPGDLGDAGEADGSRQGGVFVAQIDLADEMGTTCTP